MTYLLKEPNLLSVVYISTKLLLNIHWHLKLNVTFLSNNIHKQWCFSKNQLRLNILIAIRIKIVYAKANSASLIYYLRIGNKTLQLCQDRSRQDPINHSTATCTVCVTVYLKYSNRFSLI